MKDRYNHDYPYIPNKSGETESRKGKKISLLIFLQKFNRMKRCSPIHTILVGYLSPYLYVNTLIFFYGKYNTMLLINIWLVFSQTDQYLKPNEEACKIFNTHISWVNGSSNYAAAHDHVSSSTGMMLPSLTSSVYFFVFLGLCTWWSWCRTFDPLLFSCLCVLLAIFTAGHLIGLYLYQFQFFQEAVPPNDYYAR